MPIRAILLDLDDTLLANSMDAFIPKYLPLIARSAEKYIDHEKFIEVLLAGTRHMIENQDPNRTNSEVFWGYFQEATGLDLLEFQCMVDRFYVEDFPQLKYLTERKPEARELVRHCFDAGLSVVIATNPLFPMAAIEERLSWAGIPVDDFPYSLVTAYENMHSAKPQPAYYREILTHVHVPPQEAIMVGDDWDNDIVPADRVGIHTFWLTKQRGTQSPKSIPLLGQGSLKDFLQLMKVDRLMLAS